MLVLLCDDGILLLDIVQLIYDLLCGLLLFMQQVCIYFNDEVVDIEVCFGYDLVLINGVMCVLLVVSLNIEVLIIVVIEFKVVDLFNGVSLMLGVFILMFLIIVQVGVGGLFMVNGCYEGMVYIVMNQKF